MSANSNALLFKLLDAATQGQPPDEPENQIALLTEILENVKNADTLTDDLDLGGNDLTDSTQDTVDSEQNIRVTNSSDLSYGRNNGTLGTNSQAIGINARANNPFTTATGFRAAASNDGSNTTATGNNAARSNTGGKTTATGADSAEGNTGNNTTATGFRAAEGNTGNNTTATGFRAAASNDGRFTTATGFDAARFNTGNDTTATGFDAARSSTGNDTTATGHKAAEENTGNRTTATGVAAARGDGLADPTTMGDDNIGIGVDAIRNNQASGLIAIGQEAGINAQQDDQLIITDRNGNRRMVMDLTNGDLKIDGSLTQNANL
uniref:Uncharacterized protein n=1 Tax=uncultured virus TaxID=340016 RepID=D5L2C9_9VIRU|nr:conserved hypothetical protein [uncultured virus]